MGGPRAEPDYAVRARVERLAQRLGTEARATRVSEGMSQAAVAGRAHVSQATVARLEAGDPRLSVMRITSVFSALGLDVSLKVYPGQGIRLRDSGQIALTEVIQAVVGPTWRFALEAPVGDRSGQAADVLLLGRTHGIHIEVESALVDLQAQLRRGRLKRDALELRHGVNLAFVLALGDSERNRAAVRAAANPIRAALPAASREILTSLKTGQRLERDGLMWVRRTKPAAAIPS